MTTNETTIDNEPCRREDAGACLYDASSEHALIVAAQAGMPGAIDQLLVRHRSALFRAARRFTDSYEDAEDLVQDTMLRAFANIHRFRRESHFATWLIAIINNSARSAKRKGKGVYWLSLDSGSDDFQNSHVWEIHDSRPGPEQEIVRQELVHLLKTALSRQSSKHQAIIESCVLNERPIREAAAALGLTIGSAKSSLYRAKHRLSESCEKRGIVRRRLFPAQRVA